jgi:peptidoglycan/xylan/chitin deacetylase (PgdA/CDA1 family)
MSALVCTLHHHIGEESAFEAGLGISTRLELFERQVDWLERNFDFIDLETLLSGRLPRRPLLMTFDDAFRSVLEAVRGVLSPRGLPAVFFVNPGLLGPAAISLDTNLAWATSNFGIARVCEALAVPKQDGVGDLIAEVVAAAGPVERAAFEARLAEAFGTPDLSPRAPLLEAADLAELVRHGIEIGNHTMTHVHCRMLDADQRRHEIVEAKQRLERATGRRVRAFSLPYGFERDLTPEVLKLLRTSGHEAIFLVHARSNLRRPARDIWYRTSLTGEEPGELQRRLRYLPLARTVKHLVLANVDRAGHR